jgi:hypothetical protein
MFIITMFMTMAGRWWRRWRTMIVCQRLFDKSRHSCTAHTTSRLSDTSKETSSRRQVSRFLGYLRIFRTVLRICVLKSKWIDRTWIGKGMRVE